MGIFDRIAGMLGLQAGGASKPIGDPSGSGSTVGSTSGMGGAPVLTSDPYAELWASVERYLEAFMVQRVAPHLKYEPNDLFRLERVQVKGKTPFADERLTRFLAEFRADSRRRAFLEKLRRVCPKGVSSEYFVDFNRDFDAAVLESSDAFLAALQESIAGAYEVTLFGEWFFQEAESSAGMPLSETAVSSPPVQLDIHDANGARRVALEVTPVTLGRTPGPQGCEIHGKFVSRKHGVIERDAAGRVWYRDISANGTSVDGVPLAAGARCELRPGGLLRLGADGVGNAFSDCPEIRVDWLSPDCDDATPIRRPDDLVEATPIRGSVGAQGKAKTSSTLCLMAVEDAEGRQTIAITSLPFSVGRANDSDYRAPEINLGVSREHLVIERVGPLGADIHATGKWGTSVNGEVMPERFMLAYGQPMELASGYKDAPTVIVELLRP